MVSFMKKRILVVDDEPSVLRFLEFALKNDYHVMTASSGEEGLEILKKYNPFDLVISDMVMPGPNGLEVLKQAKALDPDIEVIILTGYATIENAVEALKDDRAYDYLRKPLDSIEELLHAVKRALERRNLRLENKAFLESLERRIQERTKTETALRESEAKMKRTEETLRNTKEQLSLLLESLPLVPYACEAGGNYRITYISPTVEEVSGFTPDRFMEKGSFWADQVHPDDRSTFLEERAQLLVGGKTGSEYRFLCVDGSYRWFSDNRRLIQLPDGSVSHIVGTWQDISEDKRIRQEAEYRLQQLIQADKLASLGEVVAGVAHEINNPNSFITYNIPLLEETWQIFRPILEDYATRHPEWGKNTMTLGELCEDMSEIIQGIRTGSDRINRVVENLKDFARMDQSGQTKCVRINDVIEKALTIVGAQLRKSIAKIEVDLSDDLPDIKGHFQKLEQVITNLLLNAAHAVPEKDKGRLSIRSRFLEKLNGVLVEIEDNGVGMEPDVMIHLFDPFFTTRRDQGGTGLGLSVSYGLIEDHHGKIGILSRPGRGSRFTVFLPVGSGGILHLQPTILCVDDDVEFLRELRSYFVEVKDTQIETISNPGEVITYLEEHPEVDIVLSDIMMPGIDGWELLQKIKARFPLLKVILCSGSPEALRHPPKLSAEPDYLLQKPFKMKQLIEIILKGGRQRL